MPNSWLLKPAVFFILTLAFFIIPAKSTNCESENEMFDENPCLMYNNVASSGNRFTVNPPDNPLLECNELMPLSQGEQQPFVKYESEGGDSKEKYILVMVDPDAPGQGYWLHWMVSDIPGADIQEGKITGTINMAYAKPTPPSNTGEHRYQFYLFQQKSPISEVYTDRGHFNLEKFVEDHNLCSNLVASFQYRAKAGN